ncbi:biotin-dependent carboxyltransferase family protein [Algoriphagus lutimaris]|uniref:5-oxoprolinase subunit C family protein n=1 Tax=Algoriphagus lutimaris TaxID=613197 RepID=UPI00196A5165|nr:biotin-dependent carboxyltransferase family protein [Algoriphagus lutimaris]MBN3518923.1 biotin-dependent carboxyltransferase family protein [Algoriphagus lutimaris]
MTILRTGPGTSIQDLGREGLGQYGIPVSGVMDSISMRWVNHILQNPEKEAVLEISLPGLKVHFGSPTIICIAGAKANITLNDSPIKSEGLFLINEGDVLSFGSFIMGSRLYLGVKKGFKVPIVLNSKSSYQGITESGMLKKGDQLEYSSIHEHQNPTWSTVKFDRSWMDSNTIEAFHGPEWGELADKNKDKIQNGVFTISKLQNRMAIQLEELIPNLLIEMSTAAVYPGTVQLTSGGKLIILMKDAQVTGGYPRILHLPEKSIAQLSQKSPNQQFIFKIINFE